MDRKKVIKGLSYCCAHTDRIECPNCPYWQDDDCLNALHADALALLTKAEVKDRMRMINKRWLYKYKRRKYCALVGYNCGECIYHHWVFNYENMTVKNKCKYDGR